MQNILYRAIQSVHESEVAISKFITANDVGETGAHQAGFHLHRSTWPLFFDSPGNRGENRDRFADLTWQDDFVTHSRFIYYGVRTRNEYRLTRFGRHFPYLSSDKIGDLLVICRIGGDEFRCYVLSRDEDIDAFLATFSIAPDKVNGIIYQRKVEESSPDNRLSECFFDFLNKVSDQFPQTTQLSDAARNCYNTSFGIGPQSIAAQPDQMLMHWIDYEYRLFKAVEEKIYRTQIQTLFQSIEDLILFANTVLNRRKSRAGKSLEHHLAAIFRGTDIAFDAQVTTEGNRSADFIFPGREAYRNHTFNSSSLIMLASKTTCKDRWRQILTEADRIPVKHLFTLQQGISANQLEEMTRSNVRLVVPQQHKTSFPANFRSSIMSLNEFIQFVRGGYR